jgi:transcriptional regulator with XRE-family HTH domain
VVAETLKALREAAGLSQQELAQRSQINQTTISALERGKIADPRISTLTGLSRAFKMPASRVLNAINESVRLAALGERRFTHA